MPSSFGAPRLHFEETINADPISVRDAILEIMRRIQHEFPAQSEGIVSTEIVLAEVLNNIAEHSYQDSNLGDIIVSVLCTDVMISFETRDYGLPMPGLTPPETELEALPVGAEDLPEGGFGWFFIRSLSSHMEYLRTGSQNIFCVQIPTAPETDN
ncbi:serine/threonine-protein kinase RsbW [Litoreibacter meonggei]|uniref:Serine/threonine-protein kinase RsbW n=1 Tax=Litoreibacter meonggei TaxID=1049199 RepID=A0A497W652_9RHOB|nr:ATP-binding protein [Litoreibacter meonggei]RLJ51891.1 serine/threonine-protein kinase RsbW [Litoreibacter meonggei]